MVSLILPLTRPEPALLETLAACVPAVAEGLVREAIVVSAHRSADLDVVIDAAGCRLVEAKGDDWTLLCQGAATARSEWLLVITPGLVPLSGWMAQIGDFLVQNDSGLIGLAQLNRKGSVWQQMGAHFRESLMDLGARFQPQRHRLPPACLIHKSALDAPQKAQRIPLDWRLADRRRSPL